MNVYISGKFRECIPCGFYFPCKKQGEISCWDWKNGRENEAKELKKIVKIWKSVAYPGEDPNHKYVRVDDIEMVTWETFMAEDKEAEIVNECVIDGQTGQHLVGRKWSHARELRH